MTSLLTILLTSLLIGNSTTAGVFSRAAKNRVVLHKDTYKPLKPKRVYSNKVFPISSSVRYRSVGNVFVLQRKIGTNRVVFVIVEVIAGKVSRVLVALGIRKSTGCRAASFEDIVRNNPVDGVDKVYVYPKTTPYCVRGSSSGVRTCSKRELTSANKGFIFGLLATKFREHLWYYLNHTQVGKKTINI